MDLLAISVSVAAPTIVGLVTFIGARKLGLTQAQQSLVTTLQSTVAAQNERIGQIEREKDECKRELRKHELRIASLTDAYDEQERQIQRMHRQLDQWEGTTPQRTPPQRTPPRRPRRSDPK